MDNGKEFIFHTSLKLPVGTSINGRLGGKSRSFQKFLNTKPVKFHPCIFPRILSVCNISIHLIGGDKKALVGLQVVDMSLPLVIRTVEDSPAFDDVVKQIVIP